MSEFAIKVENVSKAYTIWRDPTARLKHPFLNLAGELFPALRLWIDQKMQGLCTEFYALKDVSFEVKKGESVGIIGRNGSGKSTLLQIIAGTLQPTTGSVTVNGRVAALLELGSGFNPEFTGRENVYLGCSILGLSQSETDEIFDQVCSFADIGHFIDQPVKTYSSGMFVRLAFSVNMMVSPDILIVDEALSVGDMKFQSKCMTALRRLQERGTTLLFVSHDSSAVKSLCSTALVLNGGCSLMVGKAHEVSDHYIRMMRMEMNAEAGDATVAPRTRDKKCRTHFQKKRISFRESEDFTRSHAALRYGSAKATVTCVEFLDESGIPTVSLESGSRVEIRIHFLSHREGVVAPVYYVQDDKKTPLLGSAPSYCGENFVHAFPGGRYIAVFTTALPLQEGNYSLEIQLTRPIDVNESAEFLDVVPDAVVFKIERSRALKIWSKVLLENTYSLVEDESEGEAIAL